MAEVGLDGVRRVRPPLAQQASTSVLERLAHIVDRAALAKVPKHLLSIYFPSLQKSPPKIGNFWILSLRKY